MLRRNGSLRNLDSNEVQIVRRVRLVSDNCRGNHITYLYAFPISCRSLFLLDNVDQMWSMIPVYLILDRWFSLENLRNQVHQFVHFEACWRDFDIPYISIILANFLCCCRSTISGSHCFVTLRYLVQHVFIKLQLLIFIYTTFAILQRKKIKIIYFGKNRHVMNT